MPKQHRAFSRAVLRAKGHAHMNPNHLRHTPFEAKQRLHTPFEAKSTPMAKPSQTLACTHREAWAQACAVVCAFVGARGSSCARGGGLAQAPARALAQARAAQRGGAAAPTGPGTPGPGPSPQSQGGAGGNAAHARGLYPSLCAVEKFLGFGSRSEDAREDVRSVLLVCQVAKNWR